MRQAARRVGFGTYALAVQLRLKPLPGPDLQLISRERRRISGVDRDKTIRVPAMCSGERPEQPHFRYRQVGKVRRARVPGHGQA